MLTSNIQQYVAVDPQTGALHVWLNDCNDLAGSKPSSNTNGNCGTGPSSPNPSSGGSGPSQPSASPVGPANGPSSQGGHNTPIVESSIPGITVPGVVTIGNPTITPGAIPTSSGIAGLQSLAAHVTQLYASAESAIAALASETSPSNSDVSSAEQKLVAVYQAIQLLLASAQQISISSVTGPDLQLLQNLQSRLPGILSQIGSVITQLGPSTHSTPDLAAIRGVAGQLNSNGAIGEAVNSIIGPLLHVRQLQMVVHIQSPQQGLRVPARRSPGLVIPVVAVMVTVSHFRGLLPSQPQAISKALIAMVGQMHWTRLNRL